jgi:ubiquinone/menaquinone biosynthesis C-methylase UbiE
VSLVARLHSRLRGGWGADPLWGVVYDYLVEHPAVGRPVWFAGTHSDLLRLHATADEVGRLAAGSRVLDVPCGGGVALRGLRPTQDVEYVAADLAPEMLERTRRAAESRGVAHLVTTRQADVGALPFEDGEFDLVLSLTGLHCFPDPRRAVEEMARVLRPGGLLVGSALLNDTGLAFEPLRRAGRLSGLVGPSATSRQLASWSAAAGVPLQVELSGAFGYFRGVKAG